MGTQFNDGTDTNYDADGVRAFQSPPIVTAVEGISAAVLARVKTSAVDTSTTLGGGSASDAKIPTQLAVKTYVDGAVTGGATDWKDAVACATTANITLSGEQTIDGVVTSASRVLVKNQSTAANNGIYVSAAGSWSRATDADTAAEVTNGAAVLVSGGSTLGGTQWFVTSTVTTLGTDAVTWVQTTAAAAVADGSITSAKIADATIATGDLADDAVTFAKMQNVTTDRLLGRDTASTGNVEELSVTNGLEFTGSTGLQAVAWVRARPDRATVFQTGGTTYAVNGSGTLITSASTSASANVTVIQAAIDDIDGTYNATGHAGGGVVRLADQNFATNAYIELKYGVSLVGWAAFDRYGLSSSAHSPSGTTITPTGITTVDVDGGATTTNRNPAILAGRGVSGSGTQSTTNPHGCGVTGVNIDMRAVTSGQGIVIADTQFFYVDRCNIFGATGSTTGRGIEVYSTNSPDDGAHGTRITNTMIASCYIGISADGSGSTDSFIEGCRIVQMTNTGIRLGSSSGGGGWQIANNHMTGDTSTSVDHIRADAPANIINNYLDTCGGRHIILEGPSTVVGNVIKGNSGAADGPTLYAPITMGNGGGRASVISANVAQLKDTTYVALVQIDSTSGDLYRPVIMGNLLLTGAGVGVAFTGAACTSGGVAIAETNAAMTVSTTGTNPYIYGNRIIANAGF